MQEETIAAQKWELEVLQQRFEHVEKERDELYDKFVTSIHDVQQKTGLKNLLLEKKLTTLAEQLEKKVCMHRLTPSAPTPVVLTALLDQSIEFNHVLVCWFIGGPAQRGSRCIQSRPNSPQCGHAQA